MKKVLRYISTGISFFFLFMAILALKEGLIYSEQRELIGSAFIFMLPIGCLFRWISLVDRNKKQRLLEIADNISVAFIINGIISIVSHLSLPSPYIRYLSNTLIVGIVFIIVGGAGLFLLNKIPTIKKSKENF